MLNNIILINAEKVVYSIILKLLFFILILKYNLYTSFKATFLAAMTPLTCILKYLMRKEWRKHQMSNKIPSVATVLDNGRWKRRINSDEATVTFEPAISIILSLFTVGY